MSCGRALIMWVVNGLPCTVDLSCGRALIMWVVNGYLCT